MQKRLDKMADELCEARQVIVKLVKLVDAKDVGAKENKQIEKHLAQQTEHRKKDQQRKVEELNNSIEEINKKVSKIISLGGLVSKDMMKELKKLESLLDKVKQADPMNTELF